MRLAELAGKVNRVEKTGEGDPEILGLTSDSREAAPGFLFAALAGSRADGAAYIADAVARGAAAVLAEERPAVDPGVPCLVASDARKALGEAADVLYDHPSRSLDLIGITGTNGKTTTAYLLRHILNSVGRKAGMLGTIEYDLGDAAQPAPLTTPDAVRFTRGLAHMRDSGCRAAVVEVSSHALDQDRAHPHRFRGAIFTNLTRDHLDYHGDMDTYREAKRKLFLGLGGDAFAVLNFGDPAAPKIVRDCKAEIAGYHPGDDLIVTRSTIEGQAFALHTAKLSHDFRTPLVGAHNAENCASAVLMTNFLGIPPDETALALISFSGVPGRLERMESPSLGMTAFVDYAHTDDALRKAASVLRPLTRGRLITVFGCGGDRDRGKRPLMAQAAEEFSDVVVVTSDNPRTEDPEKIIRDIMPGFKHPERVIQKADRPEAIREAVRLAESGDVILVAGKGHEDYQIIGTEKFHMDDRELVREAFNSGERKAR